VTLLRKRYRILGPIGEGGMGSVSLAEDLRLPGRQCAIKCLRVPPGTDPATSARLRERFAHEATLLAHLDHPALPKVSDYFDADGCTYLVMDFVPGSDLRAVVLDAVSRGRQLPEAQVVRWAEDVCAALSYLHAQVPPVIHRDVKPANIKLTPDGQVRLVDFGLAEVVVPAGDGTVTVTVTSGAGSRPYQPLEQYGDATALDGRADVYALGATLYHLLTGHPPASAQERFLDPSRLDRPRALRPDLSDRVETAVLAALSLHPDQRPPTAGALRGLLVAPPPTRAVADPPWRRAVRTNAWLLVAVVSLLVVALVLSLWP
jgi:eukaryotic-like serine/threonine-protein kinase